MEGLRVGVTGARKGHELAEMLQRRGARVTVGPTLAAMAPEDDEALLRETDAMLAAAPRWVVASTGAGVRAWADAAAASGRGGALRELLASTKVVARGPKAVGGLRALGVDPLFVSPRETDADVAAWLAQRVRAGDSVAVQVHGGPAPLDPYTRLEQRGIDVLRVTPYRCVLPEDRQPAAQVVRRAVDGDLDVIVATSSPAARNLMAVAAELGLDDALRTALSGRGAAAAVGPVTATAFEQTGVPVRIMPLRYRTAELVRAVEAWQRRRRDGDPSVAGCGLRLLPDSCVVRRGSDTIALGGREFGVLAALVRRPGVVCSPDQMVREAWGLDADDGSQVKHQVWRLRRKLGDDADALQTVRGVGYRYDPSAASHSG